MPLISMVVVLKQFNSAHTSNKTSLFLTNIMTATETKCALMNKLLTNMQAFTYLETLANINHELLQDGQKGTEDENQERAAIKLREAYLKATSETVVELVLGYCDHLQKQVKSLPSDEADPIAFKISSLIKQFLLPFEIESEVLILKQTEMLGQMIWYETLRPSMENFGA